MDAVRPSSLANYLSSIGMRSLAIRPLQTPFSIAWCTTRTALSSPGRACARLPPSVRSLTPYQLNELMRTLTREQGPAGGRDHRNPWPASIGMGGRLRSESTADFVGIRNHEQNHGSLARAVPGRTRLQASRGAQRQPCLVSVRVGQDLTFQRQMLRRTSQRRRTDLVRSGAWQQDAGRHAAVAKQPEPRVSDDGVIIVVRT